MSGDLTAELSVYASGLQTLDLPRLYTRYPTYLV